VFVCHDSFLCVRIREDPTGHLLAAEENAAQDAEDEKQDADHNGGLEEGLVKSAAGALDRIGVSAEGTADRGFPLLQQDDPDQYQ